MIDRYFEAVPERYEIVETVSERQPVQASLGRAGKTKPF